MKMENRKSSSQTGVTIEAGGEPFIDTKELCRRLLIKPRTASAWTQSGRLVYYKLGRVVRFKWSEVTAHLAATCRVVKEQ